MAGRYFITYETASPNYWKAPLHKAQAGADAAATADTTLTAVQGDVAIPDGLRPGWIWDTTKTELQELALSDLSDLDEVKENARFTVGILRSNADRCHGLRRYFSDEACALAAATYTLGVRGIRAALLGTGTHLNSASKKIKFLEEMGSGPSDASDPDEMCYRFEDDGDGGSSIKNPFTLSDKRVVWANSTAENTPRLALKAALERSSDTDFAADVTTLADYRTEIIGLGFIDDIA